LRKYRRDHNPKLSQSNGPRKWVKHNQPRTDNPDAALHLLAETT